MNIYRLSNEWQLRRVIGDNLADALIRNGLQAPDTFIPQPMGGARRVKGDMLKIKRAIVKEREGGTRGRAPYVTAIMELEGGRIVEVDANIEEKNI